MAHSRSDFAPRDILIAAILLTRLPLPRQAPEAFDNQSRVAWAFPLVGLGLALVGALIYGFAGWIGLPVAAAAGLTLAWMIIATGAMHEDGLADTFDGLWGAFTPERRLEIMKDSQIGTYGVLALILVTGLRWIALIAAGPLALIAAATASRGLMPAVMAHVPHARDTGLSHSVGRPSETTAYVALAISVLVVIACAGLGGVLGFVIAAALVWGLSLLAQQRIGGQTGDILGASQQIAECAILLVLAT